jgi:signal transduction histidine kinase
MIMSQRILGSTEAQAFFATQAARQGRTEGPPLPTPEFVQALERELAASVGAATANAMIGQIIGGQAISVEDLMAVADESAQILEYSGRLEAQSLKLTQAAKELGFANEKLTQLSLQKDDFLSQISHELRTPMTSIRSFSEILRDMEGLSEVEKTRYASIIHSETIRLTRLLDDLLDLSVLESGKGSLNAEHVSLHDVIERAVITAQASSARVLDIQRSPTDEAVMLFTDGDRLAQVFINLVTNALKYCDADEPVLSISVGQSEGDIVIEFTDNGSGIPDDAHNIIFEKFARLDAGEGSGAGLGLAICREIISRLGGDILYVPQTGGAQFEVRLPRGRTLLQDQELGVA